MRRLALSLTAAMAIAGPAAAQELGLPGAASAYGPIQGDAASAPTDAEVMAAWPAKAAARGIEGSAVAGCKVAPSGALRACEIILERPNGQGFGAALLALAPKYALKAAPAAERPDGTDAIISASWPAAEIPPDWRVQPKPGDFVTTATDAARAWGKGGRAVMNCLEGKLGTLYQCVIVYQAPVGKGFGTMLLRFAAYLRLKPATIAGKPILYGVNIPMTFDPPDSRLIY